MLGFGSQPNLHSTPDSQPKKAKLSPAIAARLQRETIYTQQSALL